MNKKMMKTLLACLLVLAMLVCGCGAKQDGKEETKEESKVETTTESAKESEAEIKENTVKAETKDEAQKMVEEFYKGLEAENPISMTSYTDGKEVGIFIREGDKSCTIDKESNTTYYVFTEEGQHYLITDGTTAYKDDYIYQMYEVTVEMTKVLFVTGYFDLEDDDGFTFSATQTDRTENGATTSELVLVVNGTTDQGTATVTTTGKKGADGKIAEITSVSESDGTKGEYRFVFAYDGVSVDLPEYTIAEDASSIDWKYEVVESPYATIKDMKAALNEDEFANYLLGEDSYYAVLQKDGHFYQLRAQLTEAEKEAYDALDITDDDYDEKVNEIVDKLAIVECLDFTASIPAQSELDVYAGKTAADLVADGFENSGYGFTEEGGSLYFTKGGFEYSADVKVPEDFDYEAGYEYEDFAGFVVEKLTVTGPELYLLPILVAQ